MMMLTYRIFLQRIFFGVKDIERKVGLSFVTCIILVITSIISSALFPIFYTISIAIFSLFLGIYLIYKTRYTFIVNLNVRLASGAIYLTNFGANS
jgi:hypothetical protein